ncbi:MAG: replication-associated recombination protein A [Clostridia bacterium]|nr:replication-associated recombination protein A [Clostridia bacterium]
MAYQPLADRMRPKSFDDMVGQSHLFGLRGTIRRLLENNRFPNMIFSGPPGTGKTTAANIVASYSGLPFHKLNATTCTLTDVKNVIAESSQLFGSDGILLYLDEIQYFNRKQQQSLLECLESGRVTLIASTTENPYYALYSALISRSAVFEFKPVSPEDCTPAIVRAFDFLNEESGKSIKANQDIFKKIAMYGGGDVRRSLGILENAYYASDDEITEDVLSELAPSYVGSFDAAGDVHYDLLSCLQKSIRGSDPDAALFYLARILAGGDLLSACRRLQVIASEDIGAAYPLAAVIVRACTESAKELGLPEAAIPLSNAAVMLATSPKSNAAHIAYEAALADVKAGLGVTVPEHLSSPLFRGYQYPHDFPHHYVKQQYLPNDLKNKKYFTFGDSKLEQQAKAYFDMIHQNTKKN